MNGYYSFHFYKHFQNEHPWMSFNIIRDLFDGEDPNSYLVAGTSSNSGDNRIMMVKIRNTQLLEDTRRMPTMNAHQIQHHGRVNRIKVCNLRNQQFAATWSDQGQVFLWDLRRLQSAVDGRPGDDYPTEPIFTFSGHKSSGYALSWSTIPPGKLASGSCNSRIFLWDVAEESWRVSNTFLFGHCSSVKDIQWHPTSPPTLASCSSDRTLKFWDERRFRKTPVLDIEAHDKGVNAIAWNQNNSHHFLSGGDDRILKLWDLRHISQDQGPTVQISHHKKATIKNIQWHPSNEKIFAVASGDHTVSHWDLSLGPEENIPRYLKFQFESPSKISDLHWHPNMAEVLIKADNSGFAVYTPDYTFYKKDREEEDEEEDENEEDD